MVLRKKCCMIVYAECQMVLNMVFTRHTDIEWIPILKFLLHFVQQRSRNVTFWCRAITKTQNPRLHLSFLLALLKIFFSHTYYHFAKDVQLYSKPCIGLNQREILQGTAHPMEFEYQGQKNVNQPAQCVFKTITGFS